MSLFHDFRNQISWGRVCAFVALVMAVVADLRGQDVAHISVWLGVALGNYSASKVTEMICSRTTIGPAGPIAPEAAGSGLGQTC